MSRVVDDKSNHCVPFILDNISKKSSVDAQLSPVFIGVNGARTYPSDMIYPSWYWNES